MRTNARCLAAVVLLLCNCGIAAAAPIRSPFRASDDLALTGAQESLLWHALSKQARKGASAAQLNPSLYAAIPPSIALHSLPPTVTGRIPMVRPYRYAVIGNTLLIVNPADRRIVDIITP